MMAASRVRWFSLILTIGEGSGSELGIFGFSVDETSVAGGISFSGGGTSGKVMEHIRGGVNFLKPQKRQSPE